MQATSRLRRSTGVIAILIVAATLLWAILVPPVLRKQLSAKLTAMGMTDATYVLDSVTPLGLRLYDVQLAHGPAAPRIGALTVTFTPWGLMRNQIQRVIIRDAAITIENTAGDWSVAGLSLPASNGGGSVIIETVEMRSALVTLALGDSPVAQPVQGHARYSPESGRYDLSFTLPIGGSVANVQGAVAPDGQDVTLRLSAASLSASRLAARAGLAEHTKIAAELDVTANARVRSGALSALHVSIATAGFVGPEFETGPLALRVYSVGADRFNFELARSRVTAPLWVTLEDTHGVLDRDASTHRWNASLESRVRVPPVGPLSTTATARITARAHWPPEGARVAEISITPDSAVPIVTNLSATIQQAAGGVSVLGEMRTAIDGLAVDFNGFLGTGTNRTGSAVVQQFRLSSLAGAELDLVPVAMDDVNGTLSVSGAVHSTAGQMRSGGTLALRDGSLSLADPDVELTGANANLELLNLLSPATDVGQTLTFDRLEIGSVKLKDGRLIFQIESPRSFFVENFSAAWAGGRIQALATRFDPFEVNISSFIYVEKIDLVKLFNEVMGIKVAGNCLISGKIEVRYNNGGLRHISGELHSVPGSAGDLLFEDAPNLGGGIPLIEEALKDFQYRWARVDCATTDDAFDLSIQLQGRPNRELPLIFDKKAETFVRDNSGRHSVTIEELPIVLRFRSIPLELFGNESLTGALFDALKKPEVKQ
jgi:hypothetical protein